MTEQLTLDGHAEALAPPAVPPVIFHARPAVRRIALQTKADCCHCLMNADRWRAERKLPAGRRTLTDWLTAAQVVILPAVRLITQTDGSTLYLCEQHAAEHLARGDADD